MREHENALMKENLANCVQMGRNELARIEHEQTGANELCPLEHSGLEHVLSGH